MSQKAAVVSRQWRESGRAARLNDVVGQGEIFVENDGHKTRPVVQGANEENELINIW